MSNELNEMIELLEDLAGAKARSYTGDATGLAAWAEKVTSLTAERIVPLVADPVDAEQAARETAVMLTELAFAAFAQAVPPGPWELKEHIDVLATLDPESRDRSIECWSPAARSGMVTGMIQLVLSMVAMMRRMQQAMDIDIEVPDDVSGLFKGDANGDG